MSVISECEHEQPNQGYGADCLQSILSLAKDSTLLKPRYNMTPSHKAPRHCSSGRKA